MRRHTASFYQGPGGRIRVAFVVLLCHDDVVVGDIDDSLHDQHLECPPCLLAFKPTSLHQVENVCLRDSRVVGISINYLFDRLS